MQQRAPNRNAAATFVLSCLSLMPASYSFAQSEGEKNSQGNRDSLVAPDRELGTNPLLVALSLPSREQEAEVPQRVIDAAVAGGFELSTIKLEKGLWVACIGEGCSPILPATEEEIATYDKPKTISGLKVGDELTITGHTSNRHIIEREPDYGIPGLGSVSTGPDGRRTFTPAPEFKGTVRRAEGAVQSPSPASTQAPKASSTLLEFEYSQRNIEESRRNLAGIRERILGEPGTTFVVVISVPNECPPCRQYKPLFEQAARQAAENKENVVHVVFNFETFAAATKVTGVSRFPTTVFFPAVAPGTMFTDNAAKDWQSKPLLAGITRPGYQQTNVMQTGPLRELVAKGIAVADRAVQRGVRGIVGTVSQFIDLAK